MRSNLAREIFNLDGKGITIGVISDSFNAYGGAAFDVADGDLPGRKNPNGFKQPVRVLKDASGSDEGRAMVQIIHDVAPGAKLLFHTAGNSDAELATAIGALAQAGADIIVDDIGFAEASFFQDGAAAQAVTAAAQQGALYFSAAGNDSNRSYQNAFQPSTTFTFRGSTYQAHDFDPGAGVDLFQDIEIPRGDQINLVLNWDQPFGQVSSDLEMFLLDSPQFPQAGGKILQENHLLLPDGANNPAKAISYGAASSQTVYLLIAQKTDSIAPSLLKWISFGNGADADVRYEYVNDTPIAAGNSTIFGHPNAQESIAVGATFFRKTPAFSGKPPVLEAFSSFGGTPILFDPQGNRLPAPIVRPKPEFIAPDGVNTTVSGFQPFYGTSAAAPHAAAVAALMLQRAGGARSLTHAQVLVALQNGAIAIDPPGNFRSGAGLIQANAAVINSFIAQSVGSDGNDTMLGTPFADNILGLTGDDAIGGEGGYDAIFGGEGQDTIAGNSGNDYLLGQTGNDILLGGGGNDTLVGNMGNDVLAGGMGKNRLEGGSGRDMFVLGKGVALIQDFRKGQDKLGTDRRSFRQLDFVQQGDLTKVMLRNQTLAELNGVEADRLTAADFRFKVRV